MKLIKRNSNDNFESFSSGILDIFTPGTKTAAYKYQRLGYSNKVVGINRYFSGKMAGVKVDKVVSIPKGPIEITTKDIAYVYQEGYFTIEMVQLKTDTLPDSVLLTLRKQEGHKYE